MDAGDQSQHGVQRQHGTAAIADEGQRQTDHGCNTDAHTHIAANLENQCRGRTEADHAPEVILASGTDLDDSENNESQQHQHEEAADKSHLLADGGENIVRMLGRQSADLCTVSLKQSLSHQTAAGQGQQAPLGMIPGTDTHRVDTGVKQHQNTVLLVGLHKIVP